MTIIISATCFLLDMSLLMLNNMEENCEPEDSASRFRLRFLTTQLALIRGLFLYIIRQRLEEAVDDEFDKDR